MKASNKKWLLWGGLGLAAYYWYKNYGPGSTSAATLAANTAANPAAAAIAAATGAAQMAAANAVYAQTQSGN